MYSYTPEAVTITQTQTWTNTHGLALRWLTGRWVNSRDGVELLCCSGSTSICLVALSFMAMASELSQMNLTPWPAAVAWLVGTCRACTCCYASAIAWQLFFPCHSVFMIIYGFVNRLGHAVTFKVNKQITETNDTKSCFPLFWPRYAAMAERDSARGWWSSYTCMKCMRFSIVSYRSPDHPASYPWHRELKTLLTYRCDLLCRKKWRGIIATATTAEGKQFSRWRGKPLHNSVPTVRWKKLIFYGQHCICNELRLYFTLKPLF